MGETLQSERFGGTDGDGGSMRASMFSGRLPTRLDRENRFFIDRDGRLFHHILNYLRDGKFPVNLSVSERSELEREASFYGLEAMAAHLRADLKVRTDNGDGHGVFGTAAQGRAVSAGQVAEQVLNRCLEEWPEFPEFVLRILDTLCEAGG